MELEKTVKLNLLLDSYGSMLTSKMREILSMYICENLSLQEIASYFKITKPAVLDSIKKAEIKLEGFEKKLKFVDFKTQLGELAKKDNLQGKELQKLLNKY